MRWVAEYGQGMKLLSRKLAFLAFLAFALFLSPFGITEAQGASQGPRDVEFGGFPWGLRQTSGPVDPGPNTFSNAQDQVWVDQEGKAHLRLQEKGGVWFASEMMAKRDAGYGTYRFTASSSLRSLDPNIVFGFFTWDRNPGEFNREMDIEISRWGETEGPDLWFTVQPYDRPGNQFSSRLPRAPAYDFEMRWLKDRVEFSLSVLGKKVESWVYSGEVPDPGRARLRINLWLFRGRAPQGPGPYEVVVSGFSYEPAP